MTDEEAEEIGKTIRNEVRHFEIEHPHMAKAELALVIVGIIAAIGCLLFGFDSWAPLPPLAAELIRSAKLCRWSG